MQTTQLSAIACYQPYSQYSEIQHLLTPQDPLCCTIIIQPNFPLALIPLVAQECHNLLSLEFLESSMDVKKNLNVAKRGRDHRL